MNSIQEKTQDIRAATNDYLTRTRTYSHLRSWNQRFDSKWLKVITGLNINFLMHLSFGQVHLRFTCPCIKVTCPGKDSSFYKKNCVLLMQNLNKPLKASKHYQH